MSETDESSKPAGVAEPPERPRGAPDPAGEAAPPIAEPEERPKKPVNEEGERRDDGARVERGDEDREEDEDDRDDRDERDSDPEDSSPDRAAAQKIDGSVTSFWSFLKKTYASADPRSLGLFRIALAALLFVDVARRWPDVEAHYANTGWLSNHYMLFRPMSDHLFSVYLAFSTPGEVKTLMLIQLLICVLFALGWHTRIMHVLSAILIVSINSRNIMLENGGWVVLTLLTVWTMFLPLGRRFSVDALLASLKARRETSVAALNDRTEPARDTAPVISLAVAALIAQWVVIYYFNVVHKQGREWRDGTAVYYFFQQDRMVTALGAWLRDYLPVGAFRFMTYGALAMESAIALLLALPFRTPLARMLAWALCISLHLSIDAVVQLGPFSWAMVTAFWVLIPREAWETLGPRFAGRYPERELCLNPTSGFWISFARIVKRFDVLEKIRYRAVTPAEAPEVAEGEHAEEDVEEADEGEEESEADEESDAAETRAERPAQAVQRTADELASAVGQTLVVIDPESGTRYLGLPALFRLFDAVPFGFLLVLPARLPVLSRFIASWFRRAASQSEEADAYFEVEKLAGSPEPPPPSTTPARADVRRGVAVLREACVLAVVISCGSQLLMENRAIPKWLKPAHRPEWMTAIVVYPRLFQGWSMFAPSPPRDDGRLVVDGLTKDNRKLDPLTGLAPSFEVQPQEGFRMNQIWGDFHRRIGEERFGSYLDGVKEMLKRYHVITGKPEDELKSFDVWFVNESIPPPGQPRAAPTRRKIFSWHGDEPPPASKRKASPVKR
jgi:hypothetical protein